MMLFDYTLEDDFFTNKIITSQKKQKNPKTAIMVFYFSASGMQHQFNCPKSYTFWQVLPQISLSISFPSCLSTAYKNYFLLALILIEERTSSFLLSLPWIPKKKPYLLLPVNS